MQCVGNCSDPDSSKHKTYEQPILQSECMMLGEMLCWFLPHSQHPSVQLLICLFDRSVGGNCFDGKTESL